MRKIWLIAILLLSGTVAGPAALRPPVDPDSYGVYYDRREPSFYAGFAPRTPDPRHCLLYTSPSPRD